MVSFLEVLCATLVDNTDTSKKLNLICIVRCTKECRFMGKEVRETRQTERDTARGSATKKREISRTS